MYEKYATALDVLDSHLPVANQLQLVLGTNLLTDEQLYTFRAKLAHYCADIYEKYYPADSRVRDCADAWQRLAAGENVDISAFRDAAARAGDESVTWSIPWYAAWGITRASAFDAVWGATVPLGNPAKDVEFSKMLRWLRDII